MAMAPTVTPITEFPDPNDPDTKAFNREAYEFTSQTLPQLVTQLNALVAWLNAYVASAAVNTIATQTHTFVAADSALYHRATYAAGVKTFTVPEGLPDGWAVRLRNVGANDLTLVAAGAVEINPPAGGGVIVPPNGGTVFLMRVAPNVFDLVGQSYVED